MRGIPPPTPPVWSLRSSRNFQRLELKLFLAFRHLVRAAYNRPPTPPVLSLRSARNFSRAASRKQKKCDFGAPGACRPGLAWGRKARKVICAGCSWSLSVAKRLSKVLQTKSSIKNPPLTPSQKMKGAAPIWPLADLQF